MSNDPYGNTSVSPAGSPSQVLSIISLVLGILSCVVLCCGLLGGFVAIPSGIGAGITGFIALKKVKDGSGSGKGLAMAGMILGIVMTVLWVVLLIVFLLFLGVAGMSGFQNL